jgi:polyvinyl alcohol dehydrogenase (cytochrome)
MFDRVRAVASTLCVVTPIALATAVCVVHLSHAETIPGIHLYEQNCSSCHNNKDTKAPGAAHAPNLATLQGMTPERIYAAITTGPMAPMAAKLNDDQKRDLVETLSGRVLGAANVADAKFMPNKCPANASPDDPLAGPRWEGWGNSIENYRYQSAAGGVTDKNVGKMRLKWSFGFPGGVSAYGQPTVSGGRVYVGSDNAYVYSLDAKTGCVHWSFAAKGGVRTAPLLAKVSGHPGVTHAVFFGDYRANVYAVDVATGRLLWERHVDDHAYARIVGSIVMAEDKLFVPMSNWEDVTVNNPTYECCTARGNVVALDANSGKQLWKNYVIPEQPKPTRKNAQGVQQYAPAGAMVWLTPTIDLKRRRVYVGTSDAKGEIAPPQSDAIVAFDMDSGKLEWWFQGWAGDAHGTKGYVDFDFGSSPVLSVLPNGKRVLIAAQKSGVVHALDPDNKGAVVWQQRTSDSEEKVFGWRSDAVIWGPAMDDNVGYFALVNGAVIALNIADGKRLWRVEPPSPAEVSQRAVAGFPGSEMAKRTPAARWVGKQAAITVIPGAVLSGGVDGMLRAYSTKDGNVLWEYDTARDFDTSNNVRARGGTMAGPGPAIAGGMMFVNSGYGMLHATPGNVLLAFGVE